MRALDKNLPMSGDALKRTETCVRCTIVDCIAIEIASAVHARARIVYYHMDMAERD